MADGFYDGVDGGYIHGDVPEEEIYGSSSHLLMHGAGKTVFLKEDESTSVVHVLPATGAIVIMLDNDEY